MEGLRNQYFVDLHDRLNIGIVRRRVEQKLLRTSAESKVACTIATKAAGALGVLPPIPRDTRMVFIAAPIRF
jgi:hypothetical protein